MIASLILAALLVAAPARAGVADRVAAVVNEEVITLSEVYDAGGDFIEEAVAGDPSARRSMELDVLDTVIQRRLILQELRRLSEEVTDAEIEAAMDEIARANGLDREGLRREVERAGLDWATYQTEFREDFRQRKFTQLVIVPRITVNEDELRDAYRRLVAGTARPQVADLGAIFLGYPPPADDPAQAEADRAGVVERALAIRQRIVDGAPFAEVAAAEDQGPYAARGGQMGTFRQGELVAEIDGPAFALQAGEVSEPVVTPQGVFLLTVFDRRQEDARPYEEVRDRLFNQVYAGRIEEEIEQWTVSARRQSTVRIKLEGVGQP